jgi:hypothetical protein
MILTGVPFKGGMRTKGMHKTVNKITNARSVGIFSFSILFSVGAIGKGMMGDFQINAGD